MGLVSPQQVQVGSTIDSSDVNNPINTLADEINGQLDDANVNAISGTKLTSATTPGSSFDANTRGGWLASILPAPTTVTYNGNYSYDVVFNSTDLTDELSPGMRLKCTRSVTAPTQCTDLEAGSSQYYSKSSPAGTTFTDDFVAMAWVKLESYGTLGVLSRADANNGWVLRVNTDGTVEMYGLNAGSANFSSVKSYQALPLNKWVHIAVQLDMSSFTASTTTSYVMINGLDTPAVVSRGGTNPTALVQAGDLNVGAITAGSFFDGKIAQAAYFSAKVTQATIRGYVSQGLAGSETSLVSAYSFNNSIADLNTGTANNLTANGTAVATNADTPFAGGATGTTEYGVVTAASFSTHTTVTVQVPTGYALPTSGGISAVSYSPWKAPFGFPTDPTKWHLAALWRVSTATTSNATYGSFSSGGLTLTVPVGSWKIGMRHGAMYNQTTTDVYFGLSGSALTGLTAAQGAAVCRLICRVTSPSAAAMVLGAYVDEYQIVTSATPYVMYTLGATTSAGIDGTVGASEIFAEFAYV